MASSSYRGRWRTGGGVDTWNDDPALSLLLHRPPLAGRSDQPCRVAVFPFSPQRARRPDKLNAFSPPMTGSPNLSAVPPTPPIIAATGPRPLRPGPRSAGLPLQAEKAPRPNISD